MRKPVEYGDVRPREVIAAVGRLLSKQGRADIKLAQAKAVQAVYSGDAAKYDPGEVVYAVANRLIDVLTQTHPTRY